MNVLIVTNVYPTKEHPYHGIFVYEQVQAIKRLHPDVNFVVYYINGFGDKWLFMKSISGKAGGRGFGGRGGGIKVITI